VCNAEKLSLYCFLIAFCCDSTPSFSGQPSYLFLEFCRNFVLPMCFEFQCLAMTHSLETALLLLQIKHFHRNTNIFVCAFILKHSTPSSLDNVVGTATGYELDDRGVRVRIPVGSRICSSPCHPDRLSGPPSLQSNRYPGSLSLGVKRQGREADHSPPTSAEI
jgi:hypothetical protein